MSVNLVLASGRVQSLALKYATDGKPELRFTLDQEENGFHLWLPCCAFGATAERLASDLNDGDVIVITSGKLTYRKRQTKFGEQSRLEILVWTVERLSEMPPSSPVEQRSPEIDSAGRVEPALKHEAARSLKRRAYPTWQPEQN
jgi:single-stranded DNA-binding protein